MDPRWEDESIDERKVGHMPQHDVAYPSDYTSEKGPCEFIMAQKMDMALARVERDLYINKLWPALKALRRLRSLTIGGIRDGKWLGAAAKDLNIEILLARHSLRPAFDVQILAQVDPQTGKSSRVPRAWAKDSDSEAMDLDADEESGMDDA